MSTSVVNPFAFTEISRIRGMARRPLVEASALARVRRDLFGPIDHDDTRKFVMRELAAQQALASERWGFDFAQEEPLREGPGSSKYLWVKVTEKDNVPQAYSHEYITLTSETIICEAEEADVSAAAPTPPASPLEAASSTCPTASSPEETRWTFKPVASKTVRRTSFRKSMKRRRPDEVHQKKMTGKHLILTVTQRAFKATRVDA